MRWDGCGNLSGGLTKDKEMRNFVSESFLTRKQSVQVHTKKERTRLVLSDDVWVAVVGVSLESTNRRIRRSLQLEK